MRNRLILTSIVWVVILTLAAPRVSAQSFSTVLEKLDQIEARLNQIEKAQKKDVQELHALLSQVQSGDPGQDLSGLSNSVNAVQTRIDGVTQDVEQLKTNSKPSQVQSFELVISELREFITELRATLANSSASPQSTQPKMSPAEPMIASRQGAMLLNDEKPKKGSEPLLASRGEAAPKLDVPRSGTGTSTESKGIQLGDKIWFDAEMRWRSEADGRDFASQTAMDEKTLLRTMLGIKASMIEDVTVYAQIQDARKMGTNSATSGGDNNLGFQQGYMKIDDLLANSIYLQVGRFETYYGRQRIMGLGDWSNRRTYDGGRFGYAGKKAKFDLLALKVIDRSFATPSDHRDWVLYGFYSSLWKQHLDLYTLCDWDQYQKNGYEALKRWTMGTYFNWKVPSGWRVDFDAAYQTGMQYDKKLASYMVAGESSYQFKNPPKPKLGLGFDITSGDDRSDTTVIKSFNNIYYSSHTYRGYMDLFTSTTTAGLMDGFVRFAIDPMKNFTAAVDVHHFQNLEKYTTSDGGTSTALGQEIDITLRLRYRPGLDLRTGGSAFFPSKDWKPDSDPAFWFYGMITASL